MLSTQGTKQARCISSHAPAVASTAAQIRPARSCWPAYHHRFLHLSPRLAASSQEAVGSSTQQLKADLLKTVSRLNNENLRPEQQQQLTETLLNLVKRLESVNPTAQPALSPLINGRWALLYTLADTDKPMVKRSPAQSALAVAYNFFYKYVPVLAGSAVGRKSKSARGNFQEFDTVAGTVKNEAVFMFLNQQGRINVDGTAAVVDSAPAKDRLEATFLSANLTWGQNIKLTFPINLFRPTGFVDTLFLDADLRIGRGDKGTLFITRRVA